MFNSEGPHGYLKKRKGKWRRLLVAFFFFFEKNSKKTQTQLPYSTKQERRGPPLLDFLTPTMRALKSSGSYSPREAPAQQQRRVVLCPQSDNLLQTLKRLAQRKDVRVTMHFLRQYKWPLINLEPLTANQLWVLDNLATECFLCSQRFSALRRRHHCRICGQVFCKKYVLFIFMFS